MMKRPSCFVLNPLWIVLVLCFTSCTFDYTEGQNSEYTLPEITMKDFDYVRMKNGKIITRLKAEIANRYESKHLMELSNYQFEQFDTGTEEVDAVGSGGAASIDTLSNNIKMSQGVSIKVDLEDFSLITSDLEYQDKTKVLSGNKESTISITRSDGTEINGTGFYSDIRNRTWVFDSKVNGIYVYEDDETEDSTVNKTNSPAEKK